MDESREQSSPQPTRHGGGDVRPHRDVQALGGKTTDEVHHEARGERRDEHPLEKPPRHQEREAGRGRAEEAAQGGERPADEDDRAGGEAVRQPSERQGGQRDPEDHGGYREGRLRRVDPELFPQDREHGLRKVDRRKRRGHNQEHPRLERGCPFLPARRRNGHRHVLPLRVSPRTSLPAGRTAPSDDGTGNGGVSSEVRQRQPVAICR